jgi:hypothetical protein
MPGVDRTAGQDATTPAVEESPGTNPTGALVARQGTRRTAAPEADPGLPTMRPGNDASPALTGQRQLQSPNTKAPTTSESPSPALRRSEKRTAGTPGSVVDSPPASAAPSDQQAWLPAVLLQTPTGGGMEDDSSQSLRDELDSGDVRPNTRTKSASAPETYTFPGSPAPLPLDAVPATATRVDAWCASDQATVAQGVRSGDPAAAESDQKRGVPIVSDQNGPATQGTHGPESRPPVQYAGVAAEELTIALRLEARSAVSAVSRAQVIPAGFRREFPSEEVVQPVSHAASGAQTDRNPATAAGLWVVPEASAGPLLHTPDPAGDSPAAVDLPASVQKTEAPTPKAAGPLTNLSIQIGRPGAEGVELRLTERGGEMSVAVRASDPLLAQSLRQGLPELVGRLEERGFQTETWRPAAAVSLQKDSREPQRIPFEAAQGDSQQSGSHQQERGRQSQGQPEQPKWVAALADDFAESGEKWTGDFNGLTN